MVRRERRKEKMGIITQLWHLCLPLTPMQIGRNVILPAPNSELGFKLRCPCLKFSLNRPDLQIPHFPSFLISHCSHLQQVLAYNEG